MPVKSSVKETCIAAGPGRGTNKRTSKNKNKETNKWYYCSILVVLSPTPLVGSVMYTLWDPMDWGSPRILYPWDFSGKNTGVACHFLLQGIFLTQGSNQRLLHWQADSLVTEPPGKPWLLISLKWSHSVMSDLCNHMDRSLPGSHPWDFLGKHTGVGCHSFFQGLFPNQGSNLGLPHCRQTLYCLSHQGSPMGVCGDQQKIV